MATKSLKKPKYPRKPKVGKKPKQSASAEAWANYVDREEKKQAEYKKKCSEIDKAYKAKVSEAAKKAAKQKADEKRKKDLIAKAAKIGK